MISMNSCSYKSIEKDDLVGKWVVLPTLKSPHLDTDTSYSFAEGEEWSYLQSLNNTDTIVFDGGGNVDSRIVGCDSVKYDFFPGDAGTLVINTYPSFFFGRMYGYATFLSETWDIETIADGQVRLIKNAELREGHNVLVPQVILNRVID